jgi:hypothetical protein
MLKFEQLHAEDGLDLALEALRVMCEANCPTLKQLIAKRKCTAAELWREICAERGYDECEPWQGWPEPPEISCKRRRVVIVLYASPGKSCSIASTKLRRI